MTVKTRDLYHGRYFRTGGTYAVSIPPDVRDQMGLLPGEHVIMRVQHGLLWIARLTPEVVFPREKVAAVFDQLFPSKEIARG